MLGLFQSRFQSRFLSVICWILGKAADLEMGWFLTYSSANGEKAQTAWVVAQNLKKHHRQPISEAKNHRTLTYLCAEYSRKVAVLETGWFLRRMVKSFNIMVFTIFSCSPYFIIFFLSAACAAQYVLYTTGYIHIGLRYSRTPSLIFWQYHHVIAEMRPL